MGNKAFKNRQKALGLCVDCPNEASPGRIRCADCLLKNSLQAKASHYKYHTKNIKARRNQREKWRKEGRCISCGIPLDLSECGLDEGRIYCVNCRTLC